MEIKKFGNFINEDVKIPIVDVVIDNEGNIYNGRTYDGVESELTKGSLEIQKTGNKITNIIGFDGNPYPGGIDKNGQLVGVNIIDGILHDLEGKKIPIKSTELSKEYGKFFTISRDYINLIPLLPTGWVNVKIDMEVLKRVKRYASPLGSELTGINSFIEKMTELERLSGGLRGGGRKRETIQKELSALILLHYINEIKDFFTPGSSGFLFESFIAGLIPNAKVKEDNSSADVVADGKKYQIKFYSSITSRIPYKKNKVPKPNQQVENSTTSKPKPIKCDYYIISLKYSTKIEMYVLTNDSRRNDYYGNFISATEKSESFKVPEIIKAGETRNITKFSLNLINIESRIDTISKGLKSSLDSLFKELSQFQYNVETIISGVNEEGRILSGGEFQGIVDNSKSNIKQMQSKLKELIESMKFKGISFEDWG